MEVSLQCTSRASLGSTFGLYPHLEFLPTRGREASTFTRVFPSEGRGRDGKTGATPVTPSPCGEGFRVGVSSARKHMRLPCRKRGERLSWKSSSKLPCGYTSWFHFRWPSLAPSGVVPRPRISPSDCSGLGKWWSSPSLSHDLRDRCGVGLGSSATFGCRRKSPIPSCKGGTGAVRIPPLSHLRKTM